MPLAPRLFTLGLFALWSAALTFYGVRYVRGGLAARRAGGRFTFTGVDGRGMHGKTAAPTTTIALGVCAIALAVGSWSVAAVLMFVAP